MGNIISGVILFIFYYTIFALFAIPFRLFGEVFGGVKNSSWKLKGEVADSLEDFKNE